MLHYFHREKSFFNWVWPYEYLVIIILIIIPIDIFVIMKDSYLLAILLIISQIPYLLKSFYILITKN
jgi:hypothetical protein